MTNTISKIYTSRASLCALGIYLNQHHVFDDVKTLPVHQKKSAPRPMGKIDRYARPNFCWRHSNEAT